MSMARFSTTSFEYRSLVGERLLFACTGRHIMHYIQTADRLNTILEDTRAFGSLFKSCLSIKIMNDSS